MEEKITSQQWMCLLGISLLVFTLFLDVTIVANALPTIQDELSASNTELQWLPAAILLSFCSFMTVMGRLGDMYGVKKVFYGTMFVFGLASIACGFAQSIEQLIFFRFVQGISAASVSLAPGLITQNFTKSQHAKVMSVYAAIAGSGMALGPVLGGIIVDYLSWRWVFLVMAPIILLGLLICFKYVEKGQAANKEASIDLLGAVLFVIAMMSLVITTMEGESWGWGSPHVLVGYLIFAVAFISFVLVERRSKHPLIPVNLLWNRTFIPCAMSCLACGLFMAVFLFFNPLYLQIVLGKSATTSGWLLFIISGMFLLMTPIAGIITRVWGVKPSTALVSFSLIFAALCHAFFNVDGNLFPIVVGFAFFGFGWAAVNVGPTVAVISDLGEENAGTVIGAMWTMFNLAGALGLAIMGSLFRFWEKRDIIEKFNDQSMALTDENMALISEFVRDPEAVQKAASSFYEQHLPIFNLAFVESFNYVAWTLFAVSLLTFGVVMVVMKK